MPDATLERWTALLEQLEIDVHRAGDVENVDGVPAWRAPADLGPIPAELRARAEALAQAQAEAIATVAAAKRSAARHLTALRTVPQGRDDTRPVYLDASG